MVFHVFFFLYTSYPGHRLIRHSPTNLPNLFETATAIEGVSHQKMVPSVLQSVSYSGKLDMSFPFPLHVSLPHSPSIPLIFLLLQRSFHFSPNPLQCRQEERVLPYSTIVVTQEDTALLQVTAWQAYKQWWFLWGHKVHFHKVVTATHWWLDKEPKTPPVSPLSSTEESHQTDLWALPLDGPGEAIKAPSYNKGINVVFSSFPMGQSVPDFTCCVLKRFSYLVWGDDPKFCSA